MSTYQQVRSLCDSAAMDALTYHASPDAIRRAIASLACHEFAAWADDVQDAAAVELSALLESYHPEAFTTTTED